MRLHRHKNLALFGSSAGNNVCLFRVMMCGSFLPAAKQFLKSLVRLLKFYLERSGRLALPSLS